MQNTPGVASSGETRNILSRFIDTREIIELIKDLVRCPSHEGIANQETATAERIRSFLEAERIEAWLDPVLEGRCNVIARLRGSGGGRSLLLTGHTDTVPPFGMESPFEIRIENDAMYGRGTVDMKGALACMAVSMAAIRRAGITLPGDLWFAGVIDEESSSRGMRALIDRGFTADAAVVGEPTGLRMCTCHKGVEWFELIFHGRAVHAARQEEGVNAIQKAARCIMEMEERLIPILNGRVHPLIGKSTLNYGFINGGTQPSTVAGECVLQIGRRWIPSERYEDVIEDFENLLAMMRAQDPDFKAEFHPMEEESEPASKFYGNTHHEAMETALDAPIVLTAQKILKMFGPGRERPLAFSAWSDAAILVGYGRIPSIVLGPGNIESAHTEDEHLETDELIDAALIYGLLACEYCS